MLSDAAKNKVADTTAGFIRREGIIGWLLVIQSVFMVAIVFSAGSLLYELKASNESRLGSQRDLYEELVRVNRMAAAQEQELRLQLVDIARKSETSANQVAIALDKLSSMIVERRNFDILVFEELRKGTAVMQNTKDVLKRIFEPAGSAK